MPDRTVDVTGRGSPQDRPQRPEPQPLGAVLGEVIRRSGWGARLEGARIHERWDEIAGPALSRHVRPVRLLGGVLVVRVADPAWGTEVRYLAGELVARANAALGAGSVNRVQVLMGPEERPATP